MTRFKRGGPQKHRSDPLSGPEKARKKRLPDYPMTKGERNRTDYPGKGEPDYPIIRGTDSHYMKKRYHPAYN